MGDKIIVIPKTKPLTAPALVSLRNTEISSLKAGLKKTLPDGTKQESEELARIYGELRKNLSVSRIERLAARAEGEWDPDRNAVKVLRKEGKFDVFGYSLNGCHYLEYYEALFLLELNRLDIFYNSMRMSIEQGYLLLLGEEKNTNYNNYLVYSMFSRCGYIVQRYQNLSFSLRKPTAEDCIWEILLNSVQNKPISDHIRNCEYFYDIQKSRDAILSEIKNQKPLQREEDENGTDSQDICFEGRVQLSGKRKTTSSQPSYSKRARYEDDVPTPHKSFIDLLTKEEEYKRFEDLFQSLDIVKLKPQFENDESEFSPVEIQFDVFLHGEAFRKSEPKPPTFRLAVLKKNQDFPNRSEISRCYHSQELPVPVLVVSVSESKHIQGFLYYFT